jgi:maltokinase
MPEIPGRDAGESLSLIDEAALREWVVGQRWFASKAREVVGLPVVEVVTLREEPPKLVVAIVEAVFHTGTHETYQLPLGLRPAADHWRERVIHEANGWTLYDALADPALALELLDRVRSRADVAGEEGTLRFQWARAADAGPGSAVAVRAIGVEQSNTSVVFGDQLVLKAFRRVEPGVNPDLEITRFLSERGFPHIPQLAGWYEYQGRLMDATFGILQEFEASGRDGWELALDELGTRPEAFLQRVHALGEVTGAMHTILASEAADPAFAPEEPSDESLALLTATIDEEIERIFLDLREDDERVAAIVGRGQDVRERLQLRSHIGVLGRLIRTHGDYHLGQTLFTDRGWVVLDFEGEPARPLPERRLKRSPLRDVAGMLRSFAYAASASEILRGVPAPAGWEQRAREAFLDGYLGSVERTLLPPGQEATANLLSVFELEKAVYELRYELNNRPDWVGIPVAGIARLLEVEL